MRKWRNWQTHYLEVVASSRSWGFESPLSHIFPVSHALIAQRIEHLASDQGVGGSNPSQCISCVIF